MGRNPLQARPECLYRVDEGNTEVINHMEADGVIGHYAIGGAVAALFYIEIASTEDLDIFISFDDAPGTLKSGLITLTPILDYLAERGYTEFHLAARRIFFVSHSFWMKMRLSLQPLATCCGATVLLLSGRHSS